MSGYTKGPWIVYHEPSWPFGMTILSNEAAVVGMPRCAYSTKQKTLDEMRRADFFPHKEREELSAMIAEQEANARLISAAPDLLEALKKCAAVCSGDVMSKSGLIDALTDARAAISKATGEA